MIKTKQFRPERKKPQNRLTYHTKSQNFYSDSINFLRSGNPDAQILQIEQKYQIDQRIESQLKNQKVQFPSLPAAALGLKRPQTVPGIGVRPRSCLSVQLSQLRENEMDAIQNGYRPMSVCSQLHLSDLNTDANPLEGSRKAPLPSRVSSAMVLSRSLRMSSGIGSAGAYQPRETTRAGGMRVTAFEKVD